MYIRILAPYRTLQEKIAREIKEISKMGVNTWGIEGKIHGCIIDVDYYHHIMVNPPDFREELIRAAEDQKIWRRSHKR